MAGNYAISQKPFWGCHNLVALWLLQIQHTDLNDLFTLVNKSLIFVPAEVLSAAKRARSNSFQRADDHAMLVEAV
jgi:hypothetical protein